MKLRIKGDSLRLRVSPSEVARLGTEGRVEETVHLGAEESAKLTYAVRTSREADQVSLHYASNEILISIPAGRAAQWAESSDVGIYEAIKAGTRQVQIAVEKDWACLDRSDAENSDTFPNPKQGSVC